MVALAGGAGRTVMEKKRNPNFIYCWSEEFQQEFAISRKTGDVTFADGTKYSKKEIDIMVAAGTQLTLAEHRVKKIIGGEIVGCEKAGSDSKGKPVESGCAESANNAENIGREVAPAPADGTGARDGELDIY